MPSTERPLVCAMFSDVDHTHSSTSKSLRMPHDVHLVVWPSHLQLAARPFLRGSVTQMRWNLMNDEAKRTAKKIASDERRRACTVHRAPCTAL